MATSTIYWLSAIGALTIRPNRLIGYVDPGCRQFSVFNKRNVVKRVNPRPGLRLRRSKAASGGAAASCELTVHLPEGAAANSVCVISTARTVEMYAVHPSLKERAYVRTIRGTKCVDGVPAGGGRIVGGGGGTVDEEVNKKLDFDGASKNNDDEVHNKSSRRQFQFFECSTKFGTQPCAAVLVKMFGAPDAPAELRLRGVVVELRGGAVQVECS